MKVQRKVGDVYQYIVAKMGIDGQFCRDESGELDIKVFSSPFNTIICVCEEDFSENRSASLNSPVWEDSEIVEVQPRVEEDGTVVSKEEVFREEYMVKSTTSSHYSVFA